MKCLPVYNDRMTSRRWGTYYKVFFATHVSPPINKKTFDFSYTWFHLTNLSAIEGHLECNGKFLFYGTLERNISFTNRTMLQFRYSRIQEINNIISKPWCKACSVLPIPMWESSVLPTYCDRRSREPRCKQWTGQSTSTTFTLMRPWLWPCTVRPWGGQGKLSLPEPFNKCDYIELT